MAHMIMMWSKSFVFTKGHVSPQSRTYLISCYTLLHTHAACPASTQQLSASSKRHQTTGLLLLLQLLTQ